MSVQRGGGHAPPPRCPGLLPRRLLQSSAGQGSCGVLAECSDCISVHVHSSERCFQCLHFMLGLSRLWDTAGGQA